MCIPYDILKGFSTFINLADIGESPDSKCEAGLTWQHVKGH